jgi:hypothetical protein
MTAGAAAMAQLSKSHYLLSPDSNSLVNANLGAFTTVIAFIRIYFRYWNRDCFLTGNYRIHKDMGIRLLNIAIEKLYLMILFKG